MRNGVRRRAWDWPRRRGHTMAEKCSKQTDVAEIAVHGRTAGTMWQSPAGTRLRGQVSHYFRGGAPGRNGMALRQRRRDNSIVGRIERVHLEAGAVIGPRSSRCIPCPARRSSNARRASVISQSTASAALSMPIEIDTRSVSTRSPSMSKMTPSTATRERHETTPRPLTDLPQRREKRPPAASSWLSLTKPVRNAIAGEHPANPPITLSTTGR